MKKSVFPKGIEGPVQVFELVLILAIQDKTVWARFKQWLSCVLSSRQNKQSIFRSFFCWVVRAYFEIFHSGGFKILCSAENFSKENEEKNRKKKKKRKPIERGRGVVSRFFEKSFWLYFRAKNLFFKNTKCLTFIPLGGWRRKPPNLLCFFYFF